MMLLSLVFVLTVSLAPAFAAPSISSNALNVEDCNITLHLDTNGETNPKLYGQINNNTLDTLTATEYSSFDLEDLAGSDNMTTIMISNGNHSLTWQNGQTVYFWLVTDTGTSNRVGIPLGTGCLNGASGASDARPTIFARIDENCAIAVKSPNIAGTNAVADAVFYFDVNRPVNPTYSPWVNITANTSLRTDAAILDVNQADTFSTRYDTSHINKGGYHGARTWYVGDTIEVQVATNTTDSRLLSDKVKLVVPESCLDDFPVGISFDHDQCNVHINHRGVQVLYGKSVPFNVLNQPRIDGQGPITIPYDSPNPDLSPHDTLYIRVSSSGATKLTPTLPITIPSTCGPNKTFELPRLADITSEDGNIALEHPQAIQHTGSTNKTITTISGYDTNDSTGTFSTVSRTSFFAGDYLINYRSVASNGTILYTSHTVTIDDSILPSLDVSFDDSCNIVASSNVSPVNSSVIVYDVNRPIGDYSPAVNVSASGTTTIGMDRRNANIDAYTVGDRVWTVGDMVYVRAQNGTADYVSSAQKSLTVPESCSSTPTIGLSFDDSCNLIIRHTISFDVFPFDMYLSTADPDTSFSPRERNFASPLTLPHDKRYAGLEDGTFGILGFEDHSRIINLEFRQNEQEIVTIPVSSPYSCGPNKTLLLEPLDPITQKAKPDENATVMLVHPTLYTSTLPPSEGEGIGVRNAQSPSALGGLLGHVYSILIQLASAASDMMQPVDSDEIAAKTNNASGAITVSPDVEFSQDFAIGKHTVSYTTTHDNGTVAYTTQSITIEPDYTKNRSSDEWIKRPTFGQTHDYKTQLVTSGFVFNGIPLTITDNWHTEFPATSSIIGQENTIRVKTYSYDAIQQIILSLGVPQVGQAHEAESKIIITLRQNNSIPQRYDVTEIRHIQGEELIDTTQTSATVNYVACGGVSDKNKCTQVEISFVVLAPLSHEVIAIQALDEIRRLGTTYINHGVEFTGDSLLSPHTHTIKVRDGNSLDISEFHLVQQDRRYSVYEDQYGNLWTVNEYGTWSQITDTKFSRHIDDYQNVASRNHSWFYDLINVEQDRATKHYNLEKIYNTPDWWK